MLMEENQGRQCQIEEISKSIAFKEEQMIALDLKFKECTEKLEFTSGQLNDTLVCMH